MKDEYDYQLPWRPNYEITAIVVWTAFGLVAYVMYVYSGLPREPFNGLMVVCILMAARRMPASVCKLYARSE
ncbi:MULTISPECIES: hypothetical protein [Methylomonas]|uniref:Uncharacterized protein n=1 Tax=Methylomonas koyamae TaxID=702114 RepID=A0A177NTF5_9GAMM|nr:hypothetical protein [Methylomonas koyamae]OAI20360.1 hypothetical protein A1355_24045 [Methylomonas koyamae]